MKPGDTIQRRRPKGVATLDELADFDQIIDVRSPAEFLDDHIPGAISCPVLDDAQRAEIGTLYKQVSPFAAKKLGAAYISRNIAQHLESHFLNHGKNWRPLIMCWRGGQRSGAMTTVLRSIGWDANQLDGGYKRFRTQVLERLQTLPGEFRLHIVTGPTGSAKTRILQRIATLGGQILDLEAMAAHKGSVLGRLPEQQQPSQKWFETCICTTLEKLDRGQTVFVESESRKIGELRLPESLFSAMQQGNCTEIKVAREDRVAFLLKDYAYFTADPQRIAQRLDTLRPLLGHERINDWQAKIENGAFEQLTESLLENHYDPLYARAQQRDFARHPRATLAAGPLDDAEIERLALTLLDRASNTPVAEP